MPLDFLIMKNQVNVALLELSGYLYVLLCFKFLGVNYRYFITLLWILSKDFIASSVIIDGAVQLFLFPMRC